MKTKYRYYNIIDKETQITTDYSKAVRESMGNGIYFGRSIEIIK